MVTREVEAADGVVKEAWANVRLVFALRRQNPCCGTENNNDQ
jgi:hypothetical protein